MNTRVVLILHFNTYCCNSDDYNVKYFRVTFGKRHKLMDYYFGLLCIARDISHLLRRQKLRIHLGDKIGNSALEMFHWNFCNVDILYR